MMVVSDFLRPVLFQVSGIGVVCQGSFVCIICMYRYIKIYIIFIYIYINIFIFVRIYIFTWTFQRVPNGS